MVLGFSNQIPVLLILLLFFVETAAIKCYVQPGVDFDQIDRERFERERAERARDQPPKIPNAQEEREEYMRRIQLLEDNMYKWIERDCRIDRGCVVATGCRLPMSSPFDMRGCASSGPRGPPGSPSAAGPQGGTTCAVQYSVMCEKCRICEGDLCNTGKIAAFSLMLMLAAGIFVIMVSIMFG